MKTRTTICLLAGLIGLIPHGERNACRAQEAASSIGIFEGHGEVGTVLHPGSSAYDASQRSYTLAGSGENMWFNADDFQFAWKKMSGDVALTANVSFVGTGGNAHRKAVLMIRENLDSDSVYADIALHGDGLTSLQYRATRGHRFGQPAVHGFERSKNPARSGCPVRPQ